MPNFHQTRRVLLANPPRGGGGPAALLDLKEWAADNQWIYSLGDAAAFTGYSAGDHLRITGGTNWTPGYYAIDNYVAGYDTGDGIHNMVHVTLVPSSVANATDGIGYMVLAADMPPSRYVAAFDGNSLIAGSMPDRVAIKRNIDEPSSSYRWVSRNYGVNGSTTVARDTAAAAGLDTAYHVTECNALVFSEVINDLYFGATAAQAITHLETYCANRKAVGWMIYMLEPGPRSDAGTPGTFEADRQTVLTWMRDPARIGVDYDVLIPLPAGMGAAGDETGSYYAGDNVHWGSAGAQLVANAVEAAIPNYVHAAFVSSSGNDGTAALDDDALPYLTQDAAVTALAAAAYSGMPARLIYQTNIATDLGLTADLDILLLNGLTLQAESGIKNLSGTIFFGTLADEIINLVGINITGSLVKTPHAVTTAESAGTITADTNSGIAILQLGGADGSVGNPGTNAAHAWNVSLAGAGSPVVSNIYGSGGVGGDGSGIGADGGNGGNGATVTNNGWSITASTLVGGAGGAGDSGGSAGTDGIDGSIV